MLSVRSVYWSAIVLAVLAVAGTMWFLVDPAPPDRLRLATGVEDGFYDRLGRRFAIALRRDGIEVELVETAGSAENLTLLGTEKNVDATFVQGGVGSPPPEDTNLRSLAALGIEPVWLFARKARSLTDLETMSGVKFAMGPTGSGTRDFAHRLLYTTGLEDHVESVPLTGAEAAQALLAGEVDVAAFVTSPRTSWVRTLIDAPDINLLELQYSEALIRHIPFATRVVLPARVIDYANNVPPADITILGVATILMVREQLHPAIKQLLLQVSTDVVRGDPILGTLGEFPAARLVEYPLDAEAERFFRYGPTPARLYLPFWAANLVERFWVLVIPIATLLIPIMRFGPSTLQWSMRRRIYLWYKDLRELEREAQKASTDEEVQKVLEALHKVEEQVSEVRVPLPFRDDLYRLRMQIAFVRNELVQANEGSTYTTSRSSGIP